MDRFTITLLVTVLCFAFSALAAWLCEFRPRAVVLWTLFFVLCLYIVSRS